MPVDIDLSATDVTNASKPVAISFLRALQPGALNIQFRLEGVAGKLLGTRAISLTVPAMSAEFRAEDAGAEGAGLPSAAAVILESENRPDLSQSASGFVKILAPDQEVPVGLLRIECEVKEPVKRVEFYLGEKKILVRNRAPYTVELDLGKIPKKQTLKVLGFDAQGNFVDADAWAINEKDSRLAVRILELPKQKLAGDTVELKVALQSIAGGAATKLQLWLDDTMVKEWTEPPFTVTVPVAQIQKATLMRATAIGRRGKGVHRSQAPEGRVALHVEGRGEPRRASGLGASIPTVAS